jgi:hypothetical protein
MDVMVNAGCLGNSGIGAAGMIGSGDCPREHSRPMKTEATNQEWTTWPRGYGRNVDAADDD